jgi:hypothetical protein
LIRQGREFDPRSDQIFLQIAFPTYIYYNPASWQLGCVFFCVVVRTARLGGVCCFTWFFSDEEGSLGPVTATTIYLTGAQIDEETAIRYDLYVT